MTGLAFAAFGHRQEISIASMSLMSVLTRAHAFHEGAVDALRSDNPFAAFTLLRSYAENAALLVWLKHHPDDLNRLYPQAPPDARFAIGKLLNFAQARLLGFSGVYEQLSGFAHPSAATAMTPWRAAGEDNRKVNWTSAPAFKNDGDFMIAGMWAVELAEANGHLWAECWTAYFGESPTAAVPGKWVSQGPKNSAAPQRG
ncbi:MAG TPA: hypothetical protein VGM94_11960 [Galbitalea sp.]